MRNGPRLLTAYLAVTIVTLCSAAVRAAPPPTCDVCVTAPIGCPYSSIQKAIDDASDGDTIWVCEGTYMENIDFVGKAVAVRALHDPEDTILDAGLSGSAVTFASGEGPGSLLEGLIIRNGRGTRVDGFGRAGGGVFCDGASPRVEDCILVDNDILGGYGGGGGGIYCRAGSPVFTGCTVEFNRSDFRGGGAYLEAASPTFTGCTFTRNWAAEQGAGIYADAASGLVLDGCTVSDNHVRGPFAHGGGLYLDGSDSLEMEGCALSGNGVLQPVESGDGGAAYLEGVRSATIRGCTFLDNDADGRGGALYLDGTDAEILDTVFTENESVLGGAALGLREASPVLTGCTFDLNTDTSSGSTGGGAVCGQVSSSPALTACTFTGNTTATTGGALSFERLCAPSLQGCLVTGNEAGQHGGGVSVVEASEVTLEACTVGDNTAGVGGGGISALESTLALTNCVLAGNRADGSMWDQGGGALYLQDSSVEMVNSTLTGNEAARNGGALHCLNATVSVANSILWNDRAGGASNEVYVVAGDPPAIRYSDVQGGWSPGTGNLDVAPRFAGVGDHHLDVTSPLIDAGEPASAPPGFPADDLDGDARPRHAAYDIGADEYAGELCVDGDADTYFSRDGCGTPVDCDDGNEAVHPGAEDVCDGLDNDCDGIRDPGCYARAWVFPDRAAYGVGDTHTASLSTRAGILPATVDVYLFLYVPNGVFVFFPSGSLTPAPALTSWTVTDFGPAPFFRHTFRATDPAGTYAWFALFTEPGTFRMKGIPGVGVFSFVPE